MATAAEWAVRVRAWRASGQSSREFCEGREFSAATLLWWSSRLRGKPAAAAPERVVLARVIRRRVQAGAGREVSASPVVVEIGEVRVRVESGADRATVAMVLEVLRSSAAAGAER